MWSTLHLEIVSRNLAEDKMSREKGMKESMLEKENSQEWDLSH